MRKFFFLFCFTVFFIFSFFITSVVSAGFGITPGAFSSKALCPGCSFEKVFTLSDNEPKDDQVVKVEVDGEVLQDWLGLEEFYEWEKGAKTLDIPIKFNIPSDTVLGDYSAKIRFFLEGANTSDVESNSGTAVATRSGINLHLSGTVTDEKIVDYRVNGFELASYSIVLSPDSTGGNPVTVLVNIVNDGNVPIIPERVDVEILDYNQDKVLESFSLTDWDKSIPIFSRGVLSKSFTTNLGKGKYYVYLTYYEGEEEKIKVTKFLNIVNDGSIKSGDLLSFTANKDNVEEEQEIKLKAKYKNTVDNQVMSKLVVQVLDKKGKQKEIISSDLVRTSSFETVDFAIKYTPKKEGVYTLKAHIDMEGTVSNYKEVQLTVTEKPLTPEERMMRMIKILFISLISVVGLVVLGIVFGLIFFVKKKKKKKRKARKVRKKRKSKNIKKKK